MNKIDFLFFFGEALWGDLGYKLLLWKVDKLLKVLGKWNGIFQVSLFFLALSRTWALRQCKQTSSQAKVCLSLWMIIFPISIRSRSASSHNIHMHTHTFTDPNICWPFMWFLLYIILPVYIRAVWYTAKLLLWYRNTRWHNIHNRKP